MQFSGGPRRRTSHPLLRRRIKIGGGPQQGTLKSSFKTILLFYREPPTDSISLEAFETMAVDRLKVLKAVETAGLRWKRGSKDYTAGLEKLLQVIAPKLNVLKTGSTDTATDKDLEMQKKDLISHYILQLAYCRTEELRRWFLSQEVDLFRFRFTQESAKNIDSFLTENQLNFVPIPDEEKQALILPLSACGFNNSQAVVEEQTYFKVPFTEALDLVRSRRVYLTKGSAYVPRSELVSLVLAKFRARLSHSLSVTVRALPQLEEDNRLIPLLTRLSRQYESSDYSLKKDDTARISPQQLDQLSRTSYPLCMRQLHRTLRDTHHMKHFGRMQYGLFIKGIGVTLEDALKFWKSEFMKNMDGDKFEKSYSYGIRHNYGKEGKRTNYTPYSCVKIITTNPPGTGDYHGCPFKHTDSGLLLQQLQTLRITPQSINEVMLKVNQGHPQIACSLMFRATHNLQEDVELSIHHPNHYFDESQRVIAGSSSLLNQSHTATSSQMTATQMSSTQLSQSQAPIQSSSQPGPSMNDDDLMMDESEFIPLAEIEEIERSIAAQMEEE